MTSGSSFWLVSLSVALLLLYMIFPASILLRLTPASLSSATLARMSSSTYSMVFVTVPSKEVGKQIAGMLVKVNQMFLVLRVSHQGDQINDWQKKCMTAKTHFLRTNLLPA